MKLRKLYERDIERRIDPVATVSELDEEYIQKEIDEYFFTDTLFDHLHTFLRLLADGTEGRTGVWINGYYGSGKSHFLKYIYYCLSKEHGPAALGHFEESIRKYEGDPLDQPVKEGEARAVRRKLEGLTVDPVMFNIKTVSSDERTRGSVTKTFFNRLNAFRGYNKTNIQIARFEKQLDELGKLDAFRKAYREATGDDWTKTANEAVDFLLEKVLQAAEQVADIDAASTREALQREASVTTEDLIDELEQFLSERPADYRLVFLVDEVSQFMEGQTELLLDLQTIVEETGKRLGDSVWIVCTAQQELKELVEDARLRQQADYSYGKIMARFETYLPLESQQADLITKKRVLDKNVEGREALRTFFGDQEAAIRNQFQLSSSDLYRGYDDREEFVASYPFIPYQFKLIVEVIRAFAQADFLVPGVSSTERSLIGITHHVAKSCQQEEVGYFVPFDQFYNAQLSDHLTHRARSIIGNALRLKRVKTEPFAQRVVRALFLLSNISRDQGLSFPSTAENLAFVLIDEVDPSWAELKRKTQDVLDYLVEQNVVSESENRYRFLQEEEIRIKREIDNQKITHHERLKTFAKDIIGNQVAWADKEKLEGTTIRLHRKVDDHEESSSGDVTVQFLLYNAQEEPEQIAIGRAKDDLVFCLHEHVDKEQQALLDEAVRVTAYVQDHRDNAEGERLEAINTFADQGKRALEDLRRWLAKALKKSKYISAQQVHEAREHNGQSARSLYASIVEAHLLRVYDKRDLAANYASNRSTLRKAAASTQTEIDERLTPAEREVNSYLKLETRPTVAGVMRRYSRAPYGWKDTEVIHILLNLEGQNKWAFQWNSEEVDRETFMEKAIRRQEQASVTIHEQEDVDPQLMHRVVQAVNQRIFNEKEVSSINDPKQLGEKIREVLRQKRKAAATQASDHRGRSFGRHFETLRDALEDLLRLKDTTSLFEAVVDRADQLAELADETRQLKEFWERNGDTYQAMRALVDRHEDNFSLLDQKTASRAGKVASYVRNDSHPHRDYRSALEYYEAVQQALDNRVGELQEETTSRYGKVFDDLEKRRDKLGVEEVLPDREHELEQIHRLDNLAALQNRLNRVNEFRATYLARLNDAADDEEEDTGRTSEIFDVRSEISRHELETEEDVEGVVTDLREKLLSHVQSGKIVIIK